MSDNTKTILKALLVMALWGSLFPMVKLSYSCLGIESSAINQILLFAGIRFFVCGIIIIAIGSMREKGEKQGVKKAIVPILFVGLFSIILHYTFTYICLSLTDGGKTAILKQLGVLLYICFGFLFFKDEKFSALKISGALIGFAGIAAMNFNGSGFKFNLSDTMIIGASLCTVAGSVFSKKAMENASPIMTTGISQFFGGVVLIVVSLMFGKTGMVITAKGIGVFAYICVASMVAYCMWNSIIKKAQLSKMFLIKFAEPVFACIFGAMILGEQIFSWNYLVSFLLIALGITMGNIKKS